MWRMPQIQNKGDRFKCRCTGEFETITPLEQNGDGHAWCEINKKYPFFRNVFRFHGYTPTALISEGNFICKWSQPRHSRSWGTRRLLSALPALYIFAFLNNCLRSSPWIQSGGCDAWNRVSERMAGVARWGGDGVFGRRVRLQSVGGGQILCLMHE